MKKKAYNTDMCTEQGESDLLTSSLSPSTDLSPNATCLGNEGGKGCDLSSSLMIPCCMNCAAVDLLLRILVLRRLLGGRSTAARAFCWAVLQI